MTHKMMAEKRPAENSQNVGQIGLCPSCNRISNNQDKCDKCGSQLTKELCYSSDPKRARKDAPLTNGTASPSSLAASPGAAASPATNNNTASTASTSSGVTTAAAANAEPATPVPQALYMNTSALAASSAPAATTASNPPLPQLPAAPAPAPVPVPVQNAAPTQAPSVRPQALYVNVNHQMYPLMQVSVSNNNVSQAQASIAANGNLMNAHPQLTNSLVHPRSSTGNLIPTNAVQGMQMMTGALGGVGSLQSGMPAGMGLAPPRFPPQSNHNAQSFAAVNSNNAQAQPQQQQQQQQPQAQQQQPQQQTPNKILINVQQIRIGLRGFVPASSVQFKEDGVLFTLKEYPNAPLLLNIRAIVKCKANLSGPYPALFFYLESSCIKQIRSIFHMRDWEFNEKSGIDKVKCVGVFPMSINGKEAKMIQDIFAMMRSISGRNEAILQQIAPEDILDILYGTWQGTGGDQPSEVPTQAAQQSQINHVANNAHRPQDQVARHPPSQMPPASQVLQNQMMPDRRRQVPQNVQNQVRVMAGSAMQGQGQVPTRPPVATHQMQSISRGTHATVHRSQVTTSRGGSSPPLLVIPSDNTRWQQMKKNLVTGGVYQVQMNGGQKKYCLWNGTQLMPCLVQDTEVQLQCTDVRIGSYKAPAAGTVRVQNDANKQAITFSLRDKDTGKTVEIAVPHNTIQKCLLCTQRVCALFLYVIDNMAQRLRTMCNMGHDWNKDPYYNPISKKERQRHLILFLKEVNRDQKEALLAMKTTPTGGGRSLVEEINVMGALGILSGIKSDSMVQGRIDDFFNNRGQLGTTSLSDKNMNALLKDVAGNSTASQVDDDDDDIIMTSEEVGTKCPYTQKVMTDPVRNKHCGHNYEKVAIMEFIARKRQKNIEAKCPYTACGNTVPLRMEDMVDNLELKALIQRQMAQGGGT